MSKQIRVPKVLEPTIEGIAREAGMEYRHVVQYLIVEGLETLKLRANAISSNGVDVG
ncbi:hypothetical protein L2729_16985 [Shewanella gelidimarina]|uniref:hypothetical protein n=1 Tax=Shewanella gelidimarina TaxID=56813 RepID=UPI00200FA464|nr:hypothetical protein [Shewanella gelidimarina]MCL1059667.1 hypothetical protein [Shewanella gelidimarina]